MASRPPPRYVVKPHDATGARRRLLWLGGGWLGSLLLALLIGLAVAGAWHHVAPRLADHRDNRALQAQNDDLKQQLANAQRAQQVNEVATTALRQSLTQRDEEIAGLRADLSFYSRLVGGDAQREGLKVQEIALQPVPHANAWNLTVSLTQNIKRDDDTSGSAQITVEGLRQNKVMQLGWDALASASEKSGIVFKFRYFQQLHTTLALPADFRPTSVHVIVKPSSGDTVSRTATWNDALASPATTNQGDTDAQP